MFSFFLGGAALMALVLLAGQFGQLAEATEVHWYYLLGGLCGALWVSLSLVAVNSTVPAGSLPPRSRDS